MLQVPVPDACPICERPNYLPTDHHMVPRSRGGKTTETLCRDCHKAIHSTFTNKELEREYYTVDALLAHPDFARMVAFIRKQDPTRKVTMKRSRRTMNRGRSG